MFYKIDFAINLKCSSFRACRGLLAQKDNLAPMVKMLVFLWACIYISHFPIENRKPSMDCLRGLLQNLKLEQENIRNASKVVYTIRSMSHDCTCVDMAGYWLQLSPITSSLT